MKVENMTSSRGNTVPNQFIITPEYGTEYFQSYETIIAKVKRQDLMSHVTLDTKALDYSRTTSKYLYLFLGMDRKEIEQQIKDGIIKLADLN